MQARLVIAGAIAVLALVGFFVFPGHTYLLSDTQIYIPMLERIWDPNVLAGDLVATKPHLAFTIYDEVTIALRWLSRGSFEGALIAQQLVFRILQLLGIYLLATALPLSRWLALGVAACAGLGATIAGPAVLLMEYEPVPRGFAIGLLFLAIGLAAHERFVLASSAATAAFLYHAPTTLPFWICFLPWMAWRRQWRAFLPLLAGAIAIALAAHWQAGIVERQQFFFRLDPELERLQKLRAGYNWVWNWAGDLAWQYVAMWALSLVAYWRVQPVRGRILLLGLPVIGLLSVPISYLLLDRLKWGLMSQVQPARALLFVTAVAIILGAAAGLKAANKVESVFWFVLVFAIPMRQWAAWPELRQWALAGLLAVVLAWTARLEKAAVLVPLAAAMLIPTAGQVHNYARPETADLVELEQFGKRTAPNTVFLFADSGKGSQPGIFRARSLRPVYVDWKAGGQVNYYRSLADEWWSKWERVKELKGGVDVTSLPVDYVVLTKRSQSTAQPVFQNDTYTVFKVRR